MKAIHGGYDCWIAVTYAGWAGRGFTRKVADWTLIDSAEAEQECILELFFQPFADGP